MARISAPSTKRTTTKRVSAPTPPRSPTQMPDRVQMRSPNPQQYQYGPMTPGNDSYYTNTWRPPARTQAGPAVTDVERKAQFFYQQAQQRGQPPTTGPLTFNPNVSYNTSGYINPMFRNNMLQSPRGIPAGPPAIGYQAPPRQYAPNPRQYQYGYAQPNQFYNTPQKKTFQVIPGAPQWLQNQVGQQQMGWGSGNTDMLGRQEAYDYQMANYYAKGENYTPPPNPPGGGYVDWGGWGGGGGGGGGSRSPEWYERMLNWKY